MAVTLPRVSADAPRAADEATSIVTAKTASMPQNLLALLEFNNLPSHISPRLITHMIR